MNIGAVVDIILSVLQMIVIFVVLQKYLVKGIQIGSVKG